MTPVACCFPDCTRPIKATGLCNGHYRQKQRTGKTWPFGTNPHRRRNLCSFPDCGKPAVAHGLCTGHSRQRRMGLELRPIRPPRPTSDDGYHWCSHCKQFQSVENFSWDNTRDQPKRVCRDCHCAGQRAWNKRNGLAVRRRRMRKKYGITPEIYQELWDQQSGLCAICSVAIPNLLLAEGDMRSKSAVDHCHTSGAVRGLLCGPCNSAIGRMEDDPARLRSAADYLERFTDAEASAPSP